MKSFADRIGGILTAPLATLRDAAGEGRGATDVALLIGFKLVGGSTQELAAALSRGIDTGVVSGLMAAISVLAQVLPDVVAILVGGILLSLLAPGGKGARDRALDLAAYAWIPYLTVELAEALAFTLRHRPPSPLVDNIFFTVAIGWSLAIWLCALVVLRHRREATS
jgi:hypothetical protein